MAVDSTLRTAHHWSVWGAEASFPNSQRWRSKLYCFQMYNLNENRLYLIFLRPILNELNRVNKIFQHYKASPAQLLNELMSLYTSIMDQVMRPSCPKSFEELLNYDINDVSNHFPISVVPFEIEFNCLISDLRLDWAQTVEDANIDVSLTVLNFWRKYIHDYPPISKSLTP